MKRYDMAACSDYDPAWVVPEPKQDGSWVKYEDARAAIEAAILAERTACAQLCVACDDMGTRPSQLANLIIARSKP